MFAFNNLHKLMLVVFCTRLHFYLHVYALYLQGQGLTLVQVSVIESLVIGSIFVMEVPTGVLADYLGRKWSVVAWVALMCAAETLFLFSRSYPLYLLVGFLTGTGFAFSSGALEALVYDSLPAQQREAQMAQAMGRLGSVGNLAFFLSPLLGGLLLGDLAQTRFLLAIALTAAVLFIGTLISLSLHEAPPAQVRLRQSPLHILQQGLGELHRNRPLRRLWLLMIAASSFNGTLITTLAPPYLLMQGLAPSAIGLTLSLGSLLAMFSQHQVYRLPRLLGQGGSLLFVLLLPGLGYLVLAQLQGAWPTWGWLILMYGTNEMRAPLLSARQNALIRGENRATLLSLGSMAGSLFVALMAPLYAALGERSLPLAFTMMGLWIVVAVLLWGRGANLSAQAQASPPAAPCKEEVNAA